jgi:hypothetical protein
LAQQLGTRVFPMLNMPGAANQWTPEPPSSHFAFRYWQDNDVLPLVWDWTMYDTISNESRNAFGQADALACLASAMVQVRSANANDITNASFDALHTYLRNLLTLHRNACNGATQRARIERTVKVTLVSGNAVTAEQSESALFDAFKVPVRAVWRDVAIRCIEFMLHRVYARGLP